MITKEFADGLKTGMLTIRNQTYEVEDAINNGNLIEASGKMAKLVGHALHSQAIVAAKLVYEMSELEKPSV